MKSVRESVTEFLKDSGIGSPDEVADALVKHLFADGFLIVRKGNDGHDRAPPTAVVGAKTS